MLLGCFVKWGRCVVLMMIGIGAMAIIIRIIGVTDALRNSGGSRALVGVGVIREGWRSGVVVWS